MYTDAMAERVNTFNMRLSEEETGQFDRVASHYGLPVSAMLRMLVREKDQQIRLDTAALVAAGVPAPKAPMVARRRTRANAQEATGVSLALPSFIRHALDDAAKGNGRTYEDVGHQVATRVFRQELEGGSGDVGEAALEKLMTDADLDVLKFVRKYFPRIYEAVPRARRASFAKGITRAMEEGSI